MAARELLLATANIHKVNEIRAILPPGYILRSLNDAGVTDVLPETTGTIAGNALQKARHTYDLTGINCMADDTGLVVPSLNGAPGVDSAFYAGLPRNDQRNCEKLMKDLQDKPRAAYFLCVIALCIEGRDYLFEGELHGDIALSPSGSNGFGYDPIFIPDGQVRSLAEMTPEEKNRISHRSSALKKMVDFLEQAS